MFRSPDHPELCDHHAQQELRDLDHAPVLPLAAELLGPLTDLRSAAAINATVANAYVQLADGRLDPRRAAILTYMSQILLQTLSKIGWEETRRSPAPNLEKALKVTVKASVSKSGAEKLIRRFYAAALEEAGPAVLKKDEKNAPAN